MNPTTTTFWTTNSVSGLPLELNYLHGYEERGCTVWTDADKTVHIASPNRTAFMTTYLPLHQFDMADPKCFSSMVTDAEETFAEMYRLCTTPSALTVCAPRSVSVVVTHQTVGRGRRRA